MDRLTYFDGGQWLLKKDNVTVRSHDVEELAQEGIAALPPVRIQG